MKKSTKALVYNFLGFAGLYLIVYLLIDNFTQMDGVFKPITAAVVASLLAPKFQSIRTNDGEKIFMKWLFLKGIKEVK